MTTCLTYPSRVDSVLDVACGTGLASPPVAERVGEMVGLDASLGQLRRLKAKATSRAINIHLVLGDAKTLPFRDEAFDIVLCSGALSEIMGKEEVIGEMCRVLKSGGRIAIMTMDRETIPLLRSWVYDARRLKQNLEEYRLKKIKIMKMKPFYLIARAEKDNQLT